VVPLVDLRGAVKAETRGLGTGVVREARGLVLAGSAAVRDEIVEEESRLREIEHPEAPRGGGQGIVDEGEDRVLARVRLGRTRCACAGDGAERVPERRWIRIGRDLQDLRGQRRQVRVGYEP